MTYLAGRELYTALKSEMKDGEPQWSEWQPMLYAYEDEVLDTLHKSARLRAPAIFDACRWFRLKPGQTGSGPLGAT